MNALGLKSRKAQWVSLSSAILLTGVITFCNDFSGRWLVVILLFIVVLILIDSLSQQSRYRKLIGVFAISIVPFYLYLFFAPLLAILRDGAMHLQASINLRATATAVNVVQEKHDHFPPPAITAPDGTPLLSWRVIILPYLGEEKLFNEFHLNESWDSEHNRKLIPRIPGIYKSVGKANCPEYHTFIQAFVGPGTILDPQRRVTLGEITINRGASNTALAAEGGNPVVWTKPEDIPFTLEKGIGPIGGAVPRGWQLCWG